MGKNKKVTHTAKAYPSLCSIKQPEVFPLSLGVSLTFSAGVQLVYFNLILGWDASFVQEHDAMDLTKA